MALEVHNDSAADLVVTDAIYLSPAFASPAMWPKNEETIPPGVTRALRVHLADSVCTPSPADPGVVRISFRADSGRIGTAELSPGDPYSSLGRIAAEDCAAAAIGATVLLEGTQLQIEGAGEQSVAYLLVSARPRGGAAGPVRIVRIAPSLLLTSPSGDGWPLELTVSPGDPETELRIPIVPNRCDPHAVAEDKVGTRLPIDATTSDGRQVRFPLPLAEGLRAQLLAFVGEHCGFGS